MSQSDRPWLENPSAAFAKLPKRIRKMIRRESPRATACWIWVGAKHYMGHSGKGYGRVHWKGGNRLAHRVVSGIVEGDAPPASRHFDHLAERCTSPSCVRPDHGEYVSARVNAKRANEAKHMKMLKRRERKREAEIEVPF